MGMYMKSLCDTFSRSNWTANLIVAYAHNDELD